MDTYYLAPEETERPDKSLTGPTRTEDGWLAPWFFGGVNSQLVHRSAALLKEMYGEGFRCVLAIGSEHSVRFDG